MATEIEDIQTENQDEVVPIEEKLTVNLDEDDDDGATETSEESRKGRRARERELRNELNESRTKLAAMEARLNEVSTRQPQPVYVPQQQQAADPVDQYLNDIDSQQQLILNRLSDPKISDREDAELKTRYRRLETDRVRVIARSAAPPQQQQMTQEQIDARLLESQYPEFYSNAALNFEARAEFVRLMERGKPNSAATAREAFERVRSSRGLGQRKPAPTAAERARHVSTPGTAGVQGGNSNQFTPSKAELRLAVAYCDTDKRRGLSDSQKVKIWLKECK